MEKTITKYRTLCQILIKCACLANLSVRVGSRFACAMEGSEESPVYRVPPVDRVSARTRGSRPVGPPPPSNLFDVPQPPPADGRRRRDITGLNSFFPRWGDER